jgi:hypothetical protein
LRSISDALVFRDHAVHLAADLQPLQKLSSLRLKHGRDLGTRSLNALTSCSERISCA